MDFQGIVWGSALAALFSAFVFAILPIKFTGHDKLSGVIPFAILLLIGNTFANPLVQEGCDLEKGYTIGLIATLLYLAFCVTFDLVRQIITYVKQRAKERKEFRQLLGDLREYLQNDG